MLMEAVCQLACEDRCAQVVFIQETCSQPAMLNCVAAVEDETTILRTVGCAMLGCSWKFSQACIHAYAVSSDGM